MPGRGIGGRGDRDRAQEDGLNPLRQRDVEAGPFGPREALFEDAGGVREPVWNELYQETESILARELKDRLAALRQEGRAMPVEELVAYALGCVRSIEPDH